MYKYLDCNFMTSVSFLAEYFNLFKNRYWFWLSWNILNHQDLHYDLTYGTWFTAKTCYTMISIT